MLAGGEGAGDRALFPGRPGGSHVTLDDGLANDGAAGEGDDARADVEHVTAGKGADTLVGSAAANSLAGGGDALIGGTGKDSASYVGRTADVIVTIGAGDGDDGEVGEGDDVQPTSRTSPRARATTR